MVQNGAIWCQADPARCRIYNLHIGDYFAGREVKGSSGFPAAIWVGNFLRWLTHCRSTSLLRSVGHEFVEEGLIHVESFAKTKPQFQALKQRYQPLAIHQLNRGTLSRTASSSAFAENVPAVSFLAASSRVCRLLCVLHRNRLSQRFQHHLHILPYVLLVLWRASFQQRGRMEGADHGKVAIRVHAATHFGDANSRA